MSKSKLEALEVIIGDLVQINDKVAEEILIEILIHLNQDQNTYFTSSDLAELIFKYPKLGDIFIYLKSKVEYIKEDNKTDSLVDELQKLIPDITKAYEIAGKIKSAKVESKLVKKAFGFIKRNRDILSSIHFDKVLNHTDNKFKTKKPITFNLCTFLLYTYPDYSWFKVFTIIDIFNPILKKNNQEWKPSILGAYRVHYPEQLIQEKIVHQKGSKKKQKRYNLKNQLDKYGEYLYSNLNKDWKSVEEDITKILELRSKIK